MRRHKTSRGLTLIEAMVAMSVMLVGATGLAAMSRQGLRLNADGRQLTRATTIAQDLATQIELWEYADPRLENSNTSNDADYGDRDFLYEGTATVAPDHGEADIEKGGTRWMGIPGAELAAAGYERFWNVAELDDDNGNGIPDNRRIAVIVRWPHGNGFRRVVVFVAKLNPAPEERL